MAKFTYEEYQKAVEWLDKIFKDGRYVEDYKQSICFKCGGKCCFKVAGDSNIQELMSFVWNEDVYLPEDAGLTVNAAHNFICDKDNKIDCKIKPLMCKLHPFYPRRINILYEECDFSIVVADYHRNRSLCSLVEVSPDQLKELSDFYAWLMSYPENRLVYVSYDISCKSSRGKVSLGDIAESLFIGAHSTNNTVYRR